MTARNPQFFVQDPTALTFTKPLPFIAGIQVADILAPRARQRLQATPLLHQARSYIDDQTPGEATRITIRCTLNQDDMTDVEQVKTFLWDQIGTEKQHLWVTDDDTVDTLDSSGVELIGSNVVVEYDGSQVSWLSVGNYLYYPAPGFPADDEMVVVEVHAATPSFTADLVNNHAGGATCYRVGMVYPQAVLQAIDAGPAPMGKTQSLTLRFLSGEDPMFGTSLPT